MAHFEPEQWLTFTGIISYVVIKDNKAVQVSIKDFHTESAVTTEPYYDFIIRKLDGDLKIKGHRYSDYQIQFKDAKTLDKWYFADLNWFQYFRIRFNADLTILNKSNIHQLIYGFFGGVIGAIAIKLITGSI